MNPVNKLIMNFLCIIKNIPQSPEIGFTNNVHII